MICSIGDISRNILTRIWAKDGNYSIGFVENGAERIHVLPKHFKIELSYRFYFRATIITEILPSCANRAISKTKLGGVCHVLGMVASFFVDDALALS